MPSVPKGEHQNVARAATVIDAIAGEKERGLRLTDIVERTGLGTATVHRLLGGLVEHGFIDHDPSNCRYFLGLRLLSWAAASSERYGLAAFVDESLERLRLETEDTVYFSLRSGVESVCVDRREGTFPIKTLTLNVGDRRPLGVGAGSLALLAFQQPAFIQACLAKDEERRILLGFPKDVIERDIEQTKANGFALNPGRMIEGMYAVAVPIRSKSGWAVAAISVAAITQRLSGSRLADVVNWLKREAAVVDARAAGVLDLPFIRRHARRVTS